MEMLAANKMNLRRIFAAGWQEGESDAGGKGQWRRQTEMGGWRGLEASFPHGGELNKVRETCKERQQV